MTRGWSSVSPGTRRTTSPGRAGRAVAGRRAPDLEEVGPDRWLEWQSAMDDLFPKGSRGYWKNVAFSRLNQEAVDVLVGFAAEVTWVRHRDRHPPHAGGFRRVPEERHGLPESIGAVLDEHLRFLAGPRRGREADRLRPKGLRAMEPFAETGQYVNFLGAELGHAVTDAARPAYGPETRPAWSR